MTALEAHTRATYGRALVPESWCQDDTPDAIQVFYKELFYKGKETQATDTSVICLEVECTRIRYSNPLGVTNRQVERLVSRIISPDSTSRSARRLRSGDQPDG